MPKKKNRRRWVEFRPGSFAREGDELTGSDGARWRFDGERFTAADGSDATPPAELRRFDAGPDKMSRIRGSRAWF